MSNFDELFSKEKNQKLVDQYKGIDIIEPKNNDLLNMEDFEKVDKEQLKRDSQSPELPKTAKDIYADISTGTIEASNENKIGFDDFDPITSDPKSEESDILHKKITETDVNDLSNDLKTNLLEEQALHDSTAADVDFLAEKDYSTSLIDHNPPPQLDTKGFEAELSPIPPPIPEHASYARDQSPIREFPNTKDSLRDFSPPRELTPSPNPTPIREPSPLKDFGFSTEKLTLDEIKPILKNDPPSIKPESKNTKSLETTKKEFQKTFAVLHPLANLVYWRDVKKSGIVFGSLVVILLSLTYLSFISVVAYASLTFLSGTIIFRIYMNVRQAVQKSQDGHPFKEYLELDTTVPVEKAHETADIFVAQLNSTVSTLKSLFLVEDLIDSVKFGCLLWCLTYLGSWFNGLTLVILSVVALFSLPKVYETNQKQIDQYLNIVRTQINEVTDKVKGLLSMANKEAKEKAQ